MELEVPSREPGVREHVSAIASIPGLWNHSLEDADSKSHFSTLVKKMTKIPTGEQPCNYAGEFPKTYLEALLAAIKLNRTKSSLLSSQSLVFH